MVGLRLDFIPVQPSHLRNVYTPRSPASPLESIAKRMRCSKNAAGSDSFSDSDSSSDSFVSGPPPSPYRWMWYCHQCRTGYELGVTRRCLIDNHQLCYGQTVKKQSRKGKKKKKNQACQSEFDYTGWQNWGSWKRMQGGRDEEPSKRNCSVQCDWPSQCRWARKQAQSPKQASQETVQQVKEEDAEACTHESVAEAVLQIEEPAVATANDETLPEASEATDSAISSIATAARNLRFKWTSLLSPIIEEEAASASIEDFLESHKTCDSSATSQPTTQANPLQQNPPESTAQSGTFDFDFDSRFNAPSAELEEKAETTKSVTRGLHGLVARTVSIALCTPTKTRLQQKKRRSAGQGPSSNHRRCVSAPASQRGEGIKLLDQLKGRRRMST